MASQQVAMIESFELSEALKSQLCGADFSHDGQNILNTRCEFDISKFIRLSVESFPDLEGSYSKAFKTVCITADKSKECFLIINAANGWVRKVFDHGNLQSQLTGTNTSFSDSIIESDILLYFPYWSQLGDEANTRLHFPSRMLQEAFEEGKSLKAKLQEWVDKREDYKIGMHHRGPPSASQTWFWEIQDADANVGVQHEEWIIEDRISRVTWRGGTFVYKKYPTGTEFENMRRVSSHPNIVCGFGELDGEEGIQAYFMEYMCTTLFSLIVDSVRGGVDDNKPPFSPLDSIDILLQFAKAMKHTHREGVVHCDLKSENVLISEIEISENAKRYLVKVSDFGSAQYIPDYSSEFKAGSPTTRYAAPEVIQQLQKKTFCIDFPHKVDVYSFGIVAFEVLTGQNNFDLFIKSPSAFKKGVIEGSLRPPLHSACQTNKEFIQDNELIKLIERCWDHVPLNRPSFEDICEGLHQVKVRILDKMTQCKSLTSQENSVIGPSSSAPMVTSEGFYEVDQQASMSHRHRKRHKFWPCGRVYGSP